MLAGSSTATTSFPLLCSLKRPTTATTFPGSSLLPRLIPTWSARQSPWHPPFTLWPCSSGSCLLLFWRLSTTRGIWASLCSSRPQHHAATMQVWLDPAPQHSQFPLHWAQDWFELQGHPLWYYLCWLRCCRPPLQWPWIHRRLPPLIFPPSHTCPRLAPWSLM